MSCGAELHVTLAAAPAVEPRFWKALHMDLVAQM